MIDWLGYNLPQFKDRSPSKNFELDNYSCFKYYNLCHSIYTPLPEISLVPLGRQLIFAEILDPMSFDLYSHVEISLEG